MNLIYLINLDIPEQEELGEPSEYYYKVSFVKLDNEQDIKSSLIHLYIGGNFYEHYFVVRDKKNVVLKSKWMSFYREKEIGGIENIYKYVKMCEDKTIKNEILKLVNPPKTYQHEKKLRVYYQKVPRELECERVCYLNAKNDEDAYMQELDQDNYINGVFLYIYESPDRNPTVMQTLFEDVEYGFSVRWCVELIDKILSGNDSDERDLIKIYEDFHEHRKRPYSNVS
ncbi:BA75_04720T0 [Komagataella pastoris]|uniref:BA75_04720T0 n=1 Tax=Komagataella pastoris TaxID=4922 RepID=A0A1B2JH58_PICPA|nr:BA75_04720T0 [Komagataella pastoris]